MQKRFPVLLALTATLLLSACGQNEAQPAASEPAPLAVSTPDLRISELSTSWFSDSAAWVEVYNGTDKPVNLADYQLRSFSSMRTDPYDDEFVPRSYALPSVTVQPGEYVMIGGQGMETFTDAVQPGAKQVYVRDGEWIPNWYQSGFVELTRAGATVDVVRFGDAKAEPLTPGAWQGPNAAPLVTGEDKHGKALSRNLQLADTDRAADWTPNLWQTPFGPNNIAQYAADLDLDNIPDMAEAEGQKYGALDVYALGARAGQRDLFMEVDYMRSQDPATTPRQEALDKVVAAFAARGITLHLDTGDLYGQKYNLGGGNDVGWQTCTELFTSPELREEGCRDFYAVKAEHQSALRRNVFHYALFANSRRSDGKAGSSGVAEINGNDLVISLGGWGLDDQTLNRRNALVNYQASTLMHELGHNLGLRHGGFENGPNYKPNYLSIMNYAYQLAGLPLDPSKPQAAEAWLYVTVKANREKYGLFNRCDIDNGPCSTHYRIDYSDGTSHMLNENALSERGGIGRGAFEIDWNQNGVIDPEPVQADITFDTDNEGKPAPKYTTYLRDYDDWGNLNLSFTRYWNGNNPGLNAQSVTARPRLNAQATAHDHDHTATPLFDPFQADRQTLADEMQPSAELLSSLRDIR